MTKQKWRKKLEARFGRMPQEAIEDSEIDILRGYFDHRRKAEPTVFHIDETTWQDLSLDEVYRRGISCCTTGCAPLRRRKRSTPGGGR